MAPCPPCGAGAGGGAQFVLGFVCFMVALYLNIKCQSSNLYDKDKS